VLYIKLYHTGNSLDNLPDHSQWSALAKRRGNMSLCFPPWESHFERLEGRLWANLGALTQLLWGVDCIQIVKVWIAKIQQTCIVFGTVRFWNLRAKQRTTNDMYKSKLEIWWNSPCETQSSGLKLAKLIQPRWLYNTLLLSSIKAVEVAAAFPGPSDSFDTRSRVSCTAEKCWK